MNDILIDLGIIDAPYRFLSEVAGARGLIITMNFLIWFGNTTILIMAGIMGIDTSLIEAAEIDGAKPAQLFWLITMPLLKPILVYVLITSMIGGLQLFDVAQILTNGSGNPDRTSMTLIMWLNNHLYSRNYGLGGALSVILLIISSALSLLVYDTMTREQRMIRKEQKMLRKEQELLQKEGELLRNGQTPYGKEPKLKRGGRRTMNKNTGEATRLQLQLTRAVCYIVLILISVMCLFFFYTLIINTTRSHPDIQKGFSFFPGGSLIYNFRNLMSNENLPVVKAVFNSLFISTCAALVTTYFSALTAYAVHAYDFRFRRAAYTFIMMIMMVPSQVTALGFVRLMGTFNLMDTFIPLIVPSAASPIVFFFMKQYMEAVLPLDIVEAARIDGSNEFRTFNFIVLPIMKPAIAVQGIFSFVSSWNNYFIPSLILKSTENKTVPLLIAQLRSADFLKFDMGQVYMLITIAIVPVIIVYLLLSRFIIRGITLGSVKG